MRHSHEAEACLTDGVDGQQEKCLCLIVKTILQQAPYNSYHTGSQPCHVEPIISVELVRPDLESHCGLVRQIPLAQWQPELLVLPYGHTGR